MAGLRVAMAAVPSSLLLLWLPLVLLRPGPASAAATLTDPEAVQMSSASISLAKATAEQLVENGPSCVVQIAKIGGHPTPTPSPNLCIQCRISLGIT